jgi:LacI family xylobiose transport system transcriptional regulator
LQGIEARYIDGYRAALDAAGVPYDATLCLSAGFSYEAGYETAREWLRLSDRPTGICFHSDMAALGAIAAARELGVLVPDDLAVIGYDDTQMAGWVKPALTTLRARRRDEARAACELLLALVDGTPAPDEPLVIATDLVIRQSTD